MNNLKNTEFNTFAAVMNSKNIYQSIMQADCTLDEMHSFAKFARAIAFAYQYNDVVNMIDTRFYPAARYYQRIVDNIDMDTLRNPAETWIDDEFYLVKDRLAEVAARLAEKSLFNDICRG